MIITPPSVAATWEGTTMTALRWGHHYVMVRPDHFRTGRPHAVMSHMRYAERRTETTSAQPFFADLGFTTSYVGREGVGAHFEAGDAFAFGDALVVGYGPRTEELGLKHLANDLGIRVRGFRITHPGMYHLDLAFNPLDARRAMVCPAALDEASAAALLALVPEPLVLTEEEALARPHARGLFAEDGIRARAGGTTGADPVGRERLSATILERPRCAGHRPWPWCRPPDGHFRPVPVRRPETPSPVSPDDPLRHQAPVATGSPL